MYRRPLIPQPSTEPKVSRPAPGEGGPDEVTFNVTGGSVTLLVPPDTPDHAVFKQDCPFIYCQLYLEDRLILEAWIPEDTPYLLIRQQATGQAVCERWSP